MAQTQTITAKIIAEHKIRQASVAESLKTPITKITSELVDKIIQQTGLEGRFVEESLQKLYPHGAIGSFMTEYFEMAFKGRDEATEFEKATVKLFRDVFGFEAHHVGPIGLTPDVLILSDSDGYAGIIDNKAYSKYTISNDHHNRMVHNYIEGFHNYCSSNNPLSFFSYIAGGFGTNINGQLKKIIDETNINGSAVTVSHVIQMVDNHQSTPYTHAQIKNILSVNRRVLVADL